jgi:hypothetical protein
LHLHAWLVRILRIVCASSLYDPLCTVSAAINNYDPISEISLRHHYDPLSVTIYVRHDLLVSCAQSPLRFHKLPLSLLERLINMLQDVK